MRSSVPANNEWIVGRCSGGNCVQVMYRDGKFLVRDSKNPDQPPMVYDRKEWDAFVAGVRNGDFDFEVGGGH